MPKYKLDGWRRQPPDPRDMFEIISERKIARLPAAADVSPNMGPQLDQGAEGSCGPNTSDELITYDQKVQGLSVLGASRLYIYYWTRYLMGTVNQDSGVDNRTMMKAMAAYGFPPEAMWPYDDTTASMVRRPTPDVIAAARANVLSDYMAVIQSLSQMKGVIAGGKPFMFGFDVFTQMESDQCAKNGIVADPPRNASPIGGHDITFCGYTDVQRPGVEPGNIWPAGTFKFRNHWMNSPTEPWGDGGYGYMSYSYAVGPHASDFWLINTIPGGTVPVPPVPVPVPPDPTPVPPTPTPSVKTFSFAYDQATGLASEVVVK